MSPSQPICRPTTAIASAASFWRLKVKRQRVESMGQSLTFHRDFFSNRSARSSRLLPASQPCAEPSNIHDKLDRDASENSPAHPNWGFPTSPRPQSDDDERHGLAVPDITAHSTPLELAMFENLTPKPCTDGSLSMQAKNLSMLDYYEELVSDPSARGLNETFTISSQLESPTVASESHLSGDSSQPEQSKLETVKVRSTVALLQMGLRRGNISRETAHGLYCQLPPPRISHLDESSRYLFMLKMGKLGPQEKNEISMMQYLSVFDDLHSAGLKPRIWEWAAAIHLSGRCFREVTMSEVENAMRIWRRMEDEAGVRSDTITMNILLDIALKAGQLDLAEVTVEEMRKRKLRFDRFTHLGIIYLKGLRGDGDGVRNAYRNLVTANEVVDSMALTCVIAALLRAGEVSAATNVYERMMARSLPRKGRDENSPAIAWELGRLIARFTRENARDPKMMNQLQGDIVVRPNIITYINLVAHHAEHTGELVTIASLLDDMHFARVPIHGAIFTELFKGFARHGDKMYTSWTQDRLESLWTAFKRHLQAGTPDVYVAPLLAVAVLQAYRKCISRERALNVLEELRSNWRKRHESHEFNEEWLRFATGLDTSGVPRINRPGKPILPG